MIIALSIYSAILTGTFIWYTVKISSVKKQLLKEITKIKRRG